MGTLFGLIAGIGLVITSWDGELSFWGLPIFIIAALLGVFLFPFTVGTFMTGIMFASPIAIIAALINSNSQSALAALTIGISAFITQFIIGRIRGGEVI